MKLTRRRFLQTMLALTGSAAAGAVYATKIEPRWVSYTRRTLPIRNLPASLAGSTLIHLSDLHIGDKFDYQYILDTFDDIRELKPDFVVYTGDFVSYQSRRQLRQFGEVAPRLPLGGLGTAAIFGNHDYGHGWRQREVAEVLAAQLTLAGVTVLRNEQVDFAGLNIIGIDDYWSPNFNPGRAMGQLNPRAANLTLVHNPDVVDLDFWEGYEGWILAGHTHGGQVKPPFLPPPLLPVENKRYTAGEFALGEGRFLYINRALGGTISLRFNVRPEVGVFTLVSA